MYKEDYETIHFYIFLLLVLTSTVFARMLFLKF
jgi:hypothetical protein